MLSSEERFQEERELEGIAHPGIVGTLQELLDLERQGFIGKGSVIGSRHDIIDDDDPGRVQKIDGVCEVAKGLLEGMQSI